MLGTVFRAFMPFGICHCVAGSVFPLSREYINLMGLRGTRRIVLATLKM